MTARHQRIGAGAGALLCLALAAAPAAGQPPSGQPPRVPATPQAGDPEPGEPQEPVEVEETIIVTATRSDRRLQDEPLRVEVVDREEIEEKALMTPGSVAMLLAETTGLRVQTTAPSLGAASVRIQGLRGHYSLMLADGLPLYGMSGNALSLLQVPPLDLGQVEIIKGAASALYGPSALGGVINLVARRPRETAVDALGNLSTQTARDLTLTVARAPQAGWSWLLLGGYHGQSRQDLDDDGWTDMAAYERGVVRPRVFFEDGRGGSLFVTGGFTAEDRSGGTVPGAVAPDGQPFPETLDTRRGDAGGVWRTLLGERLLSARGSYADLRQARMFGDARERLTRRTWFGEASLTGTDGRHTWVVGTAMSGDLLRDQDVPALDYRFTAPGVFVQDELSLGARAGLAASLRADAHNEYGWLISPRVSLLLRGTDAFTLRLSGGGGAYAPTPFTEETDETGFSRLEPLDGLRAERAASASIDATWATGPWELSATLFGSRVNHPVQLVEATGGRQHFENADDPTRTWGTELLLRWRRGPWLAMMSHGYTSSTEPDPGADGRRSVPLTPGQAASLNVIWEDEDRGRLGLEVYYTGRQPLDDNPYRASGARYVLFGVLAERPIGPISVFLNFENIGNVRQTKYDPLVRPTRATDGRWTVDAWAPLDGFVVNGGTRITWGRR